MPHSRERTVAAVTSWPPDGRDPNQGAEIRNSFSNCLATAAWANANNELARCDVERDIEDARRAAGIAKVACSTRTEALMPARREKRSALRAGVTEVDAVSANASRMTVAAHANPVAP